MSGEKLGSKAFSVSAFFTIITFPFFGSYAFLIGLLAGVGYYNTKRKHRKKED